MDTKRPRTFQSLRGRLKTPQGRVACGREGAFQSLRGRLKTSAHAVHASREAEFQSLRGRLKTFDADAYSPERGVSFNPSEVG